MELREEKDGVEISAGISPDAKEIYPLRLTYSVKGEQKKKPVHHHAAIT